MITDSQNYRGSGMNLNTNANVLKESDWICNARLYHNATIEYITSWLSFEYIPFLIDVELGSPPESGGE